MKIHIGKYPGRLTCDMYSDYMKAKYGISASGANIDYEDHIVEALDDIIQSVYNVFNRIWFDKRMQKTNIQIDPWDTWSMDNTLAPIILIMLKQLQKTKHGSTPVDDEDVPAELSSTNTSPNKDKWDPDDNVHKRWDWVLEEIIWTFEQKCRDSWQADFYYNKWDMEGQKAHQARMDNGFRLFGKYYEGLWD